MLAVVVLHYGNPDDTLECLESLARQDYPDFEIILVDNSAKEKLRAEQIAKFSNLHFIQNLKNLGFAEGNNVGIRFAMKRGADAVLLLNNDATAAPDLLSAFAKAMKVHPEAGAFGAKILFYDEPTLLWHAGGEVHPKTLRCYHRGCGDSDLEKKWEAVEEIGYACGCALLVTKEAIERAGLMEPRFFLLWEEIDWCWNIRAAGLRCLYLPEAKVWHKVSQAFEGGNRGPSWQYYYFRGRLLFIERHLRWKERLTFYFGRFVQELGQMLFKTLHPKTPEEQRKLHLSALKGVRDYLIRRFY